MTARLRPLFARIAAWRHRSDETCDRRLGLSATLFPLARSPAAHARRLAPNRSAALPAGNAPCNTGKDVREGPSQRFRHAHRPPGEQLESSRVRFDSAHQAQLIAAAFFGSTRDDRCELDQRVLPLLVLGAAMIASSHPDNFRKRGITTKQTVHSRGDGKGPLSAIVRGEGSQSTRA